MRKQNKTIRKISISVLFILLFFVLAGLTYMTIKVYQIKKSEKVLEEVNLKLKWLHQSQFAGNYVAVEKGFYEEEGLKVNLIPFSFENPTINDVITGKATFGITGADELVVARSDGLPLKAIAVIYKINPVCAYSLKESKIKTPKDFIGKTVGLERGTNVDLLYYAMMSKLGIDRNLINEVSIGYDAKELIEGKTDVSTGYITNEPHLAIESGKEVNIILMADYGVNIYADVIFTRDDVINTNPQLVEKFLRATLKGWQYVIEHEDESVNITMKYAKSNSRTHEIYMLRNSIPLIHTGDSLIGMMDKKEWENINKILLDQKIIEKEINVDDLYTNYFLEKIYGKKIEFQNTVISG